MSTYFRYCMAKFPLDCKMQLLDEGRTEPSFLTLPGQKCMMWIAFCQLHVSTYFLWVSGKLIYSNVFLSFLFPYNVLRGNPTFGVFLNSCYIFLNGT